MNVSDGFGATVQSANLTSRSRTRLPTAQFAVRGTGTPATNSTTNDANANRVYIGQPVTLDGDQEPGAERPHLRPGRRHHVHVRCGAT